MATDGTDARKIDRDLPAHDGTTVTVPTGEIIDVHLGATNTDPDAVGDRRLAICPDRPLGNAYPEGLSFGDGAHKCPGAHVAMLETDIFLTKLFAQPGVRMETPPQVSFNDAIGGYRLRGLTVAVGG